MFGSHSKHDILSNEKIFDIYALNDNNGLNVLVWKPSCITGTSWGKSTGYQWSSFTKGQWHGVSVRHMRPVKWTSTMLLMPSHKTLNFARLILQLSLSDLLLTHSSRVTHICVNKLTIVVWDNGLSPERRQAIIWTNARILLIGPFSRNFSEILIVIHTFSFNKMRLNMSSAKRRPFPLGPNVLSR